MVRKRLIKQKTQTDLSFVFVILSFLVFSCTNREDRKSDDLSDKDAIVSSTINNDSLSSDPSENVGKYVYLDMGDCLHVRKNCVGLLTSSDVVLLQTSNDEARLRLSAKEYALQRINMEDLTTKDVLYCCRKCVDDDVYDYLLYVISKGKSHNEHKETE